MRRRHANVCGRDERLRIGAFAKPHEVAGYAKFAGLRTL